MGAVRVPVTVWAALRGARSRAHPARGGPPRGTAGHGSRTLFRLRGHGLPRWRERRRAISTSRSGWTCRRAGRAHARRARARAGATAPMEPRAAGALRRRCSVTDRGKPLYMIGVVADMLKVLRRRCDFTKRKGSATQSHGGADAHVFGGRRRDIARLLRLTRTWSESRRRGDHLKMRRRMVDMQKQIEDPRRYVRTTAATARPASRGTPRSARAPPLDSWVRSICSERRRNTQ